MVSGCTGRPGLGGATAQARSLAQAQSGGGERPAAVGVSRPRVQAARAGAMVEKEEAGGGISEEEAAQYDRQIRLWGLEAQKRSGLVQLVGLGCVQGASGLRRSPPSGSGRV